MIDPIADMLIRIKNAYAVSHRTVIIPFSRVKMEIAKILKKEGYISDYQKIEYNKRTFLKVKLKYIEKQPAISGLRRVSKPGLRVYVSRDISSGCLGGIGVVSTSSGLKTNKEARKEGLGGELLCEVW
jgi:small subunit ribosomal protein S8